MVRHFLILLLLSIVPILSEAQDEEVFLSPSIKYGPYVWWHWTGSNFSKEGITKDLEAMKSTGVSGATIFNITSAVQESHVPMGNNPWPEQSYRSEAYWEALKHAAKEAARLGIDLGLHNTVGYSTTGGPWIDQESGMKCLVKTDTLIDGGRKVHIPLKRPIPPIYSGWGSFRIKTDKYFDIAVCAVKYSESELPSDFINISEKLSENGILDWQAPEGKWRIFRIGYAPTMSNPHPVPDDLLGKVFEVDKMSYKYNKYHWNNVIEPLKEELGEYLGKSFKHILIDSYEAGNQTWTDGFEKEFYKIKNYDPIPWLTGCIGTEEERKRFDYDFKDVVSYMFYNNGFKVGRDIIHNYGLQLYFEPYGGPFNTVSCTTLADVPMGEFWTHSSGAINGYVVSSARAAGKNIIAAEAFTSTPENSSWTEDPAFLKYSADGAFSSGVNRLVLHHWVHQPFDDKYQPGISMGWWGTHFNRHQTWFEPGKAFFQYITRIQYMLQQGQEDVDFLCLDNIIGKCDVITSRDLLSMKIKIKDGKIILPSGRTYPFLVCPKINLIEPDVLERLIEFSDKGLVIVGPKPIKSPSLNGYPKCDEKIAAMTEKLKLCGSIDEARKITRTRIPYWISAQWGKVQALSRSTKEGKIVFLANRTNEVQRFELKVDIYGRIPQIWDPETGKIYELKDWKFTDDKYTSVNMLLNENQTLFVVFKDLSECKKCIAFDGTDMELCDSLRIRGGWNVEFIPKLGERFNLYFDQLSDFKYNTDKRVMYFSGKAIYRKKFDLESRITNKDMKYILSLGEMNDIAKVLINGNDAGVWWYPPYKKDVTEFLIDGENELIVEVTVNWANCLIGDEQEDKDFELGNNRGSKGRAMKSYPDWFVNNLDRPSKRKTFVIWFYHNVDSPLQNAGLVGPVQIKCYK